MLMVYPRCQVRMEHNQCFVKAIIAIFNRRFKVGKRVLFLILGFGMVTAGIAGITYSIVDQNNKLALQKVETVKEEARMAAAEGDARLEEKKQEIDKLANNLEEQRRRFEASERQLKEEMNRFRREAAQRKEVIQPQAPSSRGASLAKKEDAQGRAAREIPEQSPPRKASRVEKKERGVDWIARKAGLEAVKLLEPVEYYNRVTRERVLAEPIDVNRSDYARVRVRVWKNERIVKDGVMRIDDAPEYDQKMSRI